MYCGLLYKHRDKMTDIPRILTFDIETGAGPNAFKPDLSCVLTLSYKWAHEKTAKSLTILDYGDLDKRKMSEWDGPILDDFMEIIVDADIIVGHFSSLFDMPYLSGRAFILGKPAFPPCIHVDVWRELKRNMNFSSNRAKHIAKITGQDNQKLDNNWPTAWVEVARYPEKHIPALAKYNRGDVHMTEETFFRILPFTKNRGLIHKLLCPKDMGCPKCGSNNFERRGRAITTSGHQQRYQCKDCGGWFCDSTGKMKVRDL
jgi:DNA polymerase elongation subunit (family B)